MGNTQNTETIVLDTPEQIHRASLIALKYALRLQVRGMKHSGRGRSALTIAREAGYTTKRTARGAYEDVCALLAVE